MAVAYDLDNSVEAVDLQGNGMDYRMKNIHNGVCTGVAAVEEGVCTDVAVEDLCAGMAEVAPTPYSKPEW